MKKKRVAALLVGAISGALFAVGAKCLLKREANLHEEK